MFVKPFLKKIKMKSIIKFSQFLYLTKFKSSIIEPVIFICEKNDWAIKNVGQHITGSINKMDASFIKLTSFPKYHKNKVIHFGSQYMWVDWYKFLPKNNHYIVSFFHGKKEDGKEVEDHIVKFIESVPYLKTIIVSSSIIKKRLLSWGVPSNQIHLNPIRVDNFHFKPTTSLRKNYIRKEYGIHGKSIVIGSFQKDGIGWGKGYIPKLIKGPDIFINVIKLLKAQSYDITVFLTGPSRGYIKKELEKINVKFIHKYFKNQSDLLNCYHALDLYLITSREEGGPMGLMEAMASGIPVVSTPVGMAVDLIKNNFSGKISVDFNHNNVTKILIDLIGKTKLKKVIIKNALSAVDNVNWTKISNSHYKNVYLPLVNK